MKTKLKAKLKPWPGRFKKENCNTGYCRHCKLYGWPGKPNRAHAAALRR